MNILHEKRKLMPYGNPQAPIAAFVVANASTIAIGAAVGAVGAAVNGGNILKGALFGAVFSGVGAGVSQALRGAGGAAVGGADKLVGGAASAPVSDAIVQKVAGGVAQPGVAASSAVTGGSLPVGTAIPMVGEAATSALTPRTGLLSTAGPAAPANSLSAASEAAKNTAINQTGSSTTIGGKLMDGLTSEKGIAGLLDVGGRTLTGMAQGKADQARYDREKRDAKFGNVQSGSRYRFA